MEQPSAEHAFATLLGESAVPLLKEQGFRKRKLTFTRERDGLVDVVNLQRSAGNSHESIRFYVNCGVYSVEFDRVIGRTPQQRPSEVDCQYRRRIESIATGIGPHVTVHADTDVPAAADELRAALTSALAVMGQLRGPDDIAQSVGSDIDFDVLRYRLATRDESGAREQYIRARSRFGAEDRWPRLEEQFRKAADSYDVAILDRERG
ncbi:DUF4304 domain-containing protein [Rhodococcus sp. PvR099]|uniref:DUF4304 domain-containing protein n=1 Tax=Rhodococcus sp. PvR099 TaxID=2806602 RepID=UPI001AE9E9E4|nr:DUF4304 domain-containing protein [Rhodococcus sp. PvR099]MBP1161616.1 hypothetical protein [Rhodococcus sp. PvR099]